MASKFGSFLAELKRRRVYSVATAYVVTGWIMALGAAELFPYFGIPDWAVRLVVSAAILGFPVAIVLAWAFEVTPVGVVRDADARSLTGGGRGAITRVESRSALLAVIRKGDRKETLRFDSEFRIGRDPQNEICIEDHHVSRYHARVYPDAGQWWVEDLSSRNGTFLNGRSITTEPVSATSEVRLARDGPLIVLEVPSGATTVAVD